MIFTPTRGGSKVVSRDAGYLEFNVYQEPLIANQNGIGQVNASQVNKGVWYPTVQGAIDDISSIVTQPINAVIMNTDGVNPAGQEQVTRITFSGTATNSMIMTVLGIPFTVVAGDTSDVVNTKFIAAVQDIVNDNLIFDDVSLSSIDPSICDITHLDYQPHVFETAVMNGITSSFEIVSPAKRGYGTWDELGQESKTFEGSTVTATIYYFKRVA